MDKEPAVEGAEKLLERCKTGEVISFIVVENRIGNKYQITGTYAANRHEVAGMLLLLDAAMSRLQYD